MTARPAHNALGDESLSLRERVDLPRFQFIHTSTDRQWHQDVLALGEAHSTEREVATNNTRIRILSNGIAIPLIC